MRMKTTKIYSLILSGKYAHILTTSNVSFSFTIHQVLGGNCFHPLYVNCQESSKLLAQLSNQARTVDKIVRE